MNLITFTGIKAGPVAFLGFFLSFKPYLTIKTAQHKRKNARKGLIGDSKGGLGAQARVNEE